MSWLQRLGNAQRIFRRISRRSQWSSWKTIVGLDLLESQDENEDRIKKKLESYQGESEISMEEEDILSWWR